MSVFGGDSWAREAQQRKRRVDDLITQDVGPSKSNSLSGHYKKLTNGKYACLVCPNHPVLDSPLMLSVHFKGSRHRAAVSRFKERELRRDEEVRKRLALSDSPACFPGQSLVSSARIRVPDKPLVEQARKAAAEVVSKVTVPRDHHVQTQDRDLKRPSGANVAAPVNENVADPVPAEYLAQWKSDLREHRERELKFIEAGWKRDRDGRWQRDENAEFDSDEEDPNVVLYQRSESS